MAKRNNEFLSKLWIWSELAETMNQVRRGKFEAAIENLENLIDVLGEYADEAQEDE